MEPSELVVALLALVLGVWVWGVWLTRVLAVHPLLAKPGAAWVPNAALHL